MGIGSNSVEMEVKHGNISSRPDSLGANEFGTVQYREKVQFGNNSIKFLPRKYHSKVQGCTTLAHHQLFRSPSGVRVI